MRELSLAAAAVVDRSLGNYNFAFLDDAMYCIRNSGARNWYTATTAHHGPVQPKTSRVVTVNGVYSRVDKAAATIACDNVDHGEPYPVESIVNFLNECCQANQVLNHGSNHTTSVSDALVIWF